MPYTVRKDGSADKPWCVYKKDTGDKVGCTTEEKKNAYLAALNAKAKSTTPVDETVDVELLDDVDLSPLFEEGDTSVHFCSLFITKATQDPDGTRRIKATASDTFEDSFGQRMTAQLYQNFLSRVAEDEPAPEPFVSKAWKGGMPYVSVAHYLDQDGEAVVGTPTQLWVDENKFRFKATMANTPLAEKAWSAIKKDIADNVPDDKRVRVSIAFIDWEHVHADDTHFVRKSITEVCPVCMSGTKLKDYVKGQLIHFGLTRVPVNARTPIMIERSISDGVIKTKKDDAASIVGEDFAEELEKRERSGIVGKSEAVVVRTGVDVIPVAVVSAENASNKPFGGATTLAGALDYATAKKMSWKFEDLFYMVKDVIWNVIDDPTTDKKAAAIEAVLGEMKGQFSEEALIALSTVATPVPIPVQLIQAEVHMFDMNHPLATLLSAVATTYDGVVTKSELTRAQKFQALQTSLDALAVAIKSEVDAKTPPTTVDVEETIRRVLGEMLPAFMAQSTPVASGQGRSEPRQVAPSAAATFRSTPAAAAPNSLRALARRSVGLPVEEGVSHG
jgi:hypothetical protein